MTEIEARAYIKELSSKPAFWIKDAKGGYFDIESFGLALIEVFTKSVIEDYKSSLVPVGVVTDYLERIEFFNYSSELEGEILYALGETK